MQQRWFLEVSFMGGAYHGWARQPNAPTVQQCLEEALALLLRQEVETLGAGRTDAGVHARSLWVHMDLPDLSMGPKDLVHKLNSILPQDIAVHRAKMVPQEWHARFSAVYRRYTYRMLARKDPFWQAMAWRIYPFPEIEPMEKAAQLLLQHRNFESFCRSHHDAGTTLCEIREVAWEQKDHVLEFHIEADRFLRNMVRALVGTLVQIGQGKYPPEHLQQVLEAKDRRAAGPSAPAHGLCLEKVGYPGGWLD